MSEKSIKVSGKARIDARLSIDQKALFEKATLLGGFRSLTDFIIRSATEKAEHIIEQNEVIIATRKDSELFFNSILNPELPNKALSDAAERYLKNLY